MSNAIHDSKEQSTLYASGADFCRIFADEMNNLYLLSLLLTADPEQAEQCFVAGLDDCANGNQVFKEWAQSWARRAIIKNAVRLIAPQPRETGSQMSQAARTVAAKVNTQTLRAEMSAVLDLPAFERFAFVMSVFEGYSDRECALLLGCARDSVIAGRIQAMQRFARSVGTEMPVETSRRTLELVPAPLAMPA